MACRTKLIGLCILACIISSFKIAPNPIAEKDAIQIAEHFLKINGYCSEAGNRQELSFEMYDLFDGTTDSSLLKRRHNTLRCEAFCISENNKEWHIGFLSSGTNVDPWDSASVNSDLPGRAVIVSKDGKEVRMAHKTPLFSKFRKL